MDHCLTIIFTFDIRCVLPTERSRWTILDVSSTYRAFSSDLSALSATAFAPSNCSSENNCSILFLFVECANGYSFLLNRDRYRAN